MSTRRPRGVTLIELVLAIAVISIGIAGLMLAFSTSVRSSADPQARKQAQAIAEALLDEIQLNSYTPVAGTGPNREDFNDVDDYNGYTTAGGMVGIDGAPIAGLSAYNVSPAVTVATVTLNGVTEAKLITVSVSGPGGVSIRLAGYRVNYP